MIVVPRQGLEPCVECLPPCVPTWPVPKSESYSCIPAWRLRPIRGLSVAPSKRAGTPVDNIKSYYEKVSHDFIVPDRDSNPAGGQNLETPPTLISGRYPSCPHGQERHITTYHMFNCMWSDVNDQYVISPMLTHQTESLRMVVVAFRIVVSRPRH